MTGEDNAGFDEISVTVTASASAQVGEIMFLYASTNKKTTVATPSGFTAIYKIENHATLNTIGLFYKIVTSGDIGASTTVTFGEIGWPYATKVTYTCASSAPYFNTFTADNHDYRIGEGTLYPEISGCSIGSRVILCGSIDCTNTDTVSSKDDLTSLGWVFKEGHNQGNKFENFLYDKIQLVDGTSDSCPVTATSAGGTLNIQSLLIELLRF